MRVCRIERGYGLRRMPSKRERYRRLNDRRWGHEEMNEMDEVDEVNEGIANGGGLRGGGRAR